MKKIDRVMISCNDNPNYIQFLPVVSLAWQKILGIKPTLAYVTDKKESEYAWMKEYCQDILPFKIDNSLPNGRCKTFVPRLLMRYYFPNDICMVSDIDMIPLSYRFQNLLENYIEDSLVVFGYNIYEFGDGDPRQEIHDPNLRKFPSCYTIASGKTWKQIINPKNLNNEDLIKSWYNIKYFDYKESINLPIFDDESLVRAMVQFWNPERNKVIGINRDISCGQYGENLIVHDRLDRARWKVDRNKLDNGKYIDAHCPRPMCNYLISIKELTDYLGIELIIGE